MAEGSSANAGERDNLCRANRRSCRTQSGCRSEQGALPIPRRGVDHSRKANRVKCSTGSRNARWRREPPGGNTEEPGSDHLRGSAENADREKLNDERGSKPLPVNRSRDGAGSGQAGPGWVRKRFCILLPEISALRRRWKRCRGGSLGHAWPVGTKVPTNVTAVVESSTNRARSVAAGVVSGAGWGQPVIQTPHSDESAPSRTSASWPHLLQGSGRGGCVLRVVPGTCLPTGRHKHTRKE